MSNKTIAVIVAEKRVRANEIEGAAGRNANQFQRELIADLRAEADELEAAAKLERERAEADALAVGGIVEASRKPAGDCAKLREALGLCVKEMCARCREAADALTSSVPCLEGCETLKIAKAALAAPARNCDRPLVVDGPADNNADKAWLVFHHRNPDAYFDVSGLLRCIDWLLAPAKEQKGENDEQK